MPQHATFTTPNLLHMTLHRLPGAVPIGFTTICLPPELHDALRQRKVHSRQAFHEVVAGLLSQDAGGRRRRRRAP